MNNQVSCSDFFRCDHGTVELRKRILSNGSVQYINQCLVCGHSVGGAISHSLVRDSITINMFDDDLRERYDKEKNEEWKNKRNENKLEFDKWYSEYIFSDEWKAKREKVLRRAGYVCEGCLEERAIIVHHKTYEHVGDELLFELVALCEECHRKCHLKSMQDKPEEDKPNEH